MIFSLFFILVCSHVYGTQDSEPYNVEEYLALAQNIETLFAGLYGSDNPLIPYTYIIRKLAIAYQKEHTQWQRGKHRSEALMQNLAALLEELKTHGNALLENYQFAHPNKPDQHYMLPNQNYNTQPWAPNTNTAAPPVVTHHPNFSQELQNHSLQTLCQLVMQAQQTFPQYALPKQNSSSAKELATSLAIGLLLIVTITKIVQYSLEGDLRELRRVRNNFRTHAHDLIARIEYQRSRVENAVRKEKP